MDKPVKRQINPTKAALLAQKIRQANLRMAGAEIVTDQDEVHFSELVETYLQVASVDQVIQLVNAGDIPKKHTIYGTPIALAAEFGLYDLIKPLQAAGCPVNEIGKEGMSAIEHAIANSTNDPDARTLNALLDVGASMSDGSDVLGYAAYAGHPQPVAALVARGYNTNLACPIKNETPLLGALASLSVGSPIVEVISILLSHGADPNLSHTTVSNYGGKSATHTKLPVNTLARSSSSNLTDGEFHHIVDMLVASGMKIDHERHELRHPLALCMLHQNDAVAHALLRHGANPRHTVFGYCDGISAELEAAEIAKHGQIITEAPFVLFAKQGMSSTVNYLLDHYHEDPNQLTTDGIPVIDIAEDEDTKQVLLSAITQRGITDAIDDSLGGSQSDHIPPRRRTSPTL